MLILNSRYTHFRAQQVKNMILNSQQSHIRAQLVKQLILNSRQTHVRAQENNNIYNVGHEWDRRGSPRADTQPQRSHELQEAF